MAINTAKGAMKKVPKGYHVTKDGLIYYFSSF